jgi:hypothetical protein
MTQRAELLRGFDPAFLRQFADERQAAADEHQRQAAKAQREADAARKEIKRREKAPCGS